MEETFYRARLEAHGLEPIIPKEDERRDLHRIIFDELVHGTINGASRDHYIEITKELSAKGAESVILGCTEIGMLLNEENCPLPAYDTAFLHCISLIQEAVR